MDLQAFSQQNAPQMVLEVKPAPQVEETPKIEPAPKAEAAPETNPEPRRIVQAWDTFEPEEAGEAAGTYQASLDSEGRPVVSWDGLPEEEAAEAPEASKAEPPEEEPEEETTSQTTMDTEKVDQEIEALQEKTESLERQIEREKDPNRRKALERRLAQTEQELLQKDNDSYRRLHAEVS